MKGLTSSLFMLAVVACVAPGASPQGVAVFLTSGVETRPYTAEELAHPALQEFIEYCERQGWESCDTKESPVNDLSEFDRAAHSEVRILVQLSGVQSSRTYAVEWKLYNPNSDLTKRYTLSLLAPTNWRPSYTLDFWLVWWPIDQASWQLGRWRVKIFVNGLLEIERSFDVVEDVES